MFEITEVKNKEEYNPLIINKDTPFTQAWFYGEWQEMMGRKVRRFEIRKNSETISFFQVIKYPLIFSKSLLYIPHGPVLKTIGDLNDEFLKFFSKKLINIAEEESAIFARFDPVEDLDKSAEGGLKTPRANPSASTGFDFSPYFKKSPPYAYHSVHFQPRYEWVLDINKPEKEIFEKIHSKNRYSIRLAEKRGIAVEIIENNFKKYFEDFYRLLLETAKRNNFSLHPKIYYENIFKSCERDKNAFLEIAKFNDEILAMNLLLLFGETAYFIFGGSSDKFKNLMAPHLLHWRGIVRAKNFGCKFYNFGAVSSVNSYKEFEGISRFKKRFGGRLLEYSDSYDLILKPFWYYLYNLRKWALNQK